MAQFSCRRPQVVASDNLGALTGQLGCRESAKGVDAGHSLALLMPGRAMGQGLRSVSREVIGSVMNASMALA
jgi:hypothetical protein